MEINLKRAIFMVMYQFPRPTTELVEKLLWFYERNQSTVTLIFEWDDVTGEMPISPDIRLALDEMMIAKVIRKRGASKNTTGDQSRRNYVWETVEDPTRSYYYQHDLYGIDTIAIFRYLQSDPERLLGLIRDTKNSLISKKEMYKILLEEIRTRNLIKPKRARSKTAK